MQTKQTQRLANRIRKARERTDKKGNKTPWRVVCVSVKPAILKENGDPDTGLAFQLAYNGYEPSREIQIRLGLRETCKTCHRAFRRKITRDPVIPSQARRWWNSLSKFKQEAILGRLYKMQEML